MTKLVGSYYVLAALPIWATVAIFAILMTSIVVGRDLLEGLPYQVSYSAMIGDIGLMLGVLIAATILQREGSSIQIPKLFQDSAGHISVLVSVMFVAVFACFLTINSRSGQAMDIFHDVVIVPLFMYLAVTLLPVIFKNGTRAEIGMALFCILLWASLVVFDVKYDRMNQREWLQNHGVTLVSKK